ncbi:CoA transferase [Glaciimonas sp. Gout2]|uniref:CaiB/BaiF CoA transferase family protein n=1 Tax=unclassified Glaciimonas TaxID=2644401 RepID=UPI002B23B01D|nr:MULTISPECIES: CoA transferase [unclassified Glaciimonas]MEB0012609.1 CoA transferase [Glaciimonas sp. Cout2]MEB0083960.1 CoA transferase [Glaciimonas sp. Gout2]
MTQPILHKDTPLKPALKGIRVIELGTFISAPFAATLLADFGADVIKIELPEVGDPMRTLGAFPSDGESDSGYWWSTIGRNKRSVALDIRTPEGRTILGQLLKTTELLIENFRPGTLDRWGITSAWMKEQRPDITIVRISGYGQDGPWRDTPGFDRNAQAFSGLVYVTGEKDTAPQQAGLPVCDFTAGLWAAFGAVTALLGKHLHKENVGDEVDLALYETMIPFLKDIPMKYRHQGKVTERTGNTPDYVSPGGAYLTGDNEWIFVSGTGDRVFGRLMTVVGHPEMPEQPMFKLNKDRVTHRPLLDAAINAWLKTRTTEEALAAFQLADVPAVKIQSIDDLMHHPQVISRGNFIDVPDHDRGDVCLTSPVPRLSRMPGTIRWAGQHLGESNQEVLQGELNLSEDTLADLRERKIIGR